MINDDDLDIPLDLTAIDTSNRRDEAQFVDAVMARVYARPSSPAAHIGPLWALWSMSRALTVAAALVAIALFVYARPWDTGRGGRPATVAESIGVPPEFLALLSRNGGRP